MSNPTGLSCSFCGKSQEIVKKIIAGPGVYICDECIDLCSEIVEDELGEKEPLSGQILPYQGKGYLVTIPPISPEEVEEGFTVTISIKKSRMESKDTTPETN